MNESLYLFNISEVSILACHAQRICAFSFYVSHIGWTLTTKQLLKHLKILFYHSLSFTSPPVIHCFSWCENTVCVCVCGIFVSLLYESCKMANIHLLYKVSFFLTHHHIWFLLLSSHYSSVVLIYHLYYCRSACRPFSLQLFVAAVTYLN